MAYKVRIAVPSGTTSASNALLRTVSVSPALGLWLGAASVLGIAGFLFLPKIYLVGILALAAVSLGMMFLIATTMHARVNGALLTWLLVSPLAYYFLSVPTEKPIFTFDRFVVALLTGAVIFVPRSEAVPLPKELKRAAIAWAMFVFFALTSLTSVWVDLGIAGTRLITEAFIFPALMALFVIRVFPAERYIEPMHTLISLTAIYCAAIGLVEIVTNQDLLPIPGATFYGVDQTGSLSRVNGPFGANHCYGLIGMIALFLLMFLRRLMGDKVSRARRWLHGTAVASALAMCLLPQFRTLVIGLGIVLFLELYYNRHVNARIAGCAILVLTVGALASLPAVAPTFFNDRIADPSNLYARIAQQQQTWELVVEHPWNGVGFANFMQAIQTVTNTAFHDVGSLDTAHNSLGSILAETGVAGALPFVAANVLWFLAFLRLRKLQTPVATFAYRYFLYIFICYWIMAVTLTSAYERDLNLWYMFAGALMYKLAMVERRSLALSPLTAPLSR